MYKKINADKDTYITNKYTGGVQRVSGNVGTAGTLDLFKLYNLTPGVPNNSELSRVLVHFNLQPIKDLIFSKSIDINDDSFFCKLNLKDVYGGQPTPQNFSVSVFPLSASFDEGLGKDLVYFSDTDAANWLSSSRGTLWYVSGCGLACFATGSGDYITSSLSIPNTESTQVFTTGLEDLIVDVTKIVSATLTGELPDRGFRITLSSTAEVDTNTYFVKRFASRHAYDETKRPILTYGFDDSISDDTQNLTFDTDCTINLYNRIKNNLQNLTSGAVSITGDNCLKLKMITETGGYSLTFSGSQFNLGTNPVSGTYTATVNIPSTDTTIAARIAESGSVKFTPVWMSNDSTLVFVSGSKIEMKAPSRTSASNKKLYYRINISGIDDVYSTNEDITARVFIFDDNDPYIKLVKTPVNAAGIVLSNVYYSIREWETNRVVIPFDDVKNSTKVSSDSEGMFFIVSSDTLDSGRTYIIDIMIKVNGVKMMYENASPIFRIR